jgi:hypothetical protein
LSRHFVLVPWNAPTFTDAKFRSIRIHDNPLVEDIKCRAQTSLAQAFAPTWRRQQMNPNFGSSRRPENSFQEADLSQLAKS